MTGSPHPQASLEDFWAIPEADRFHELIGGEIVPKAAPSGEHGDAQAGIVGAIRPPFQRAPGGGGGGPGGWWIATEVEILLDTGDVVRPDVLGWRRDRCPERPVGNPVRLRPDWICEVISPSNANHDTMIRPHARYAELLLRRGAGRNTAREALRRFNERDLRDLQVWYNLTWVHPLAIERDEGLQGLLARGRQFS